MNRKKANEWIENTFSEWTKEDDRQESMFYLVKKIYDDFKNRSCESCKFSDIDIYFTDYGKCKRGYGFLFNGNVEVIKDFCCNKWESKNENL